MPPRPPFTEAAGKQKRKVDQVTPQEGGHELAAAAAEQHEGAHGPVSSLAFDSRQCALCAGYITAETCSCSHHCLCVHSRTKQ